VDEHTVGEVARMSGVSVRTLHHYDEIGLLTPSGRSDAGYRLYSAADLARLRRILVYRELELGLEGIREILAEPDARAADHLRRQHRLLRDRRSRIDELLGAIQHEMEAHEMGIALTPEEQFEIFGTDRLEEHAEEARQKWGAEDHWRESARRTAAYTKDDWIRIKAEADGNIQGFVRAIAAGLPADGAEARALAEDHRRHIDRWFYPCGHEEHRGLAALYVADPRYMAQWDDLAPGFSRYVHDAILANAAGTA
jgi:DNA-binding transcriptional MerR regulator